MPNVLTSPDYDDANAWAGAYDTEHLYPPAKWDCSVPWPNRTESRIALLEGRMTETQNAAAVLIEMQSQRIGALEAGNVDRDARIAHLERIIHQLLNREAQGD